MNLLLLCARGSLDGDAIERIQSISKEDIDWKYLVETAIAHNVHCLLYKSLETASPETVKKPVFQELRSRFQDNEIRNLFFAGKLLALLKLFREHGIRAIPFKGPVLAEMVYGDFALREFGDLDVQVDRRDVLRTLDLLAGQGFRPEIDLDREQFSAYVAKKNGMLMTRTTGLMVDLHWEMSGNYTFDPLVLDEIENDLVWTTLAGHRVQHPGRESLLVYLCLYGTRNCWKDIESLSSIASLIESRDQWNWVRALDLADRMRCRRMLLLTLTLVHDLFETRLPKNVLSLIQKDSAIPDLALQVCRLLFEDREPWPKHVSKFSLFHFRVRDRWSEKIRYGKHLVFGATARDWLCFPVPGKLSFLHGLARPVRLVTVLFLSLTRNLVRFAHNRDCSPQKRRGRREKICFLFW